MFGALVGDCIGSFWEMTKNKNSNIELWVPQSRFTDDTVCTVAIADALLTGNSFGQSLHNLGNKHLNAGFAHKMVEWLTEEGNGIPPSYGSWGNGSAMRVSPIALFANNEEDLLNLATQSALPTHSHPDAIHGAKATTYTIRYVLENHKDSHVKENVAQLIEDKFGYENVLKRDLEHEREIHVFDVTCKGTVPLALSIALQSHSFEEAMRWCCSLGGDSDTLASISGPIAEVLYGIPDEDIQKAKLKMKDFNLWETVEKVYQLPHVKDRLKRWDLSYSF
jgi:ADP-ribosyl-[dinitrogen reductase] hydrolase